MKNPSESMIFLDEYLSDDANYIIEQMMDHHISKNYKNVRDIILGYNYKNRRWASKYGESLVKKEIITTESVCAFFPKSSDIDISRDIFIKSGGMIFYDDEIFDNVRIHMDDVVKRILDVLFTISENVIDYKYVTDIIVTEWNIKNTTSLHKNNVPYDIYGELHLRPIEVRESSWKEFKSIVRNKGLMTRDAFKIAAIDFLENRADMLNGKI